MPSGRHSRARDARRSALPLWVRGRAATTVTCLGRFGAASRCAAHAPTAAASTVPGHHGADPLAPALVGPSEHDHLVHAGQLAQRPFHLGRVDVDPAADDEVAVAAEQGQQAVVVEHAAVARGEPLAVERGGGLRRRVEVGEPGVLRQPHPDQPVADPQLAARAGPPDGAGVGEPEVGRADGEPGLGRPVELGDAARRERREGGPLDPVGARGARVGDEPEAREVEVGLLQQPLQVGGGGEGRRGPVPGDGGGGGARVEPRGDDDVAARQHGVEREPQRRGVRERGEDEVDVARPRGPRGRAPPRAGRGPRPPAATRSTPPSATRSSPT